MKINSLVDSVEIVATGVPRSGTLFLAHLLNWSHEYAYGINEKGYISEGPAKEPEVSWLAAPHLQRGAFVFHLIRNPNDVVRSNAAGGWLQPGNSWGDYAYRYAETWDPWVFWLRWIDLCESVASVRIHLEDISHLSAPINVGPLSTSIPVPPIPSEYKKEIVKMADRLGYQL